MGWALPHPCTFIYLAPLPRIPEAPTKHTYPFCNFFFQIFKAQVNVPWCFPSLRWSHTPLISAGFDLAHYFIISHVVHDNYFLIQCLHYKLDTLLRAGTASTNLPIPQDLAQCLAFSRYSGSMKLNWTSSPVRYKFHGLSLIWCGECCLFPQ